MKTKTIQLKFGDTKVKPTRIFINSIKSIMREEIKMMRKTKNGYPECWYCGCATIENLEQANFLSMIYGGKEDVSWIKKSGQIFVKVPF